MFTYKLKAIRKCDPFRAELAGTSELLIREWVMPPHVADRDQATASLIAWVIYECGGAKKNGIPIPEWFDMIRAEIFNNGRFEFEDLVFTLEKVQVK